MRTALDVHRDLLGREVPHEIVRLRGASIGDADDLPAALGVHPVVCVAVRCYVTEHGPLAAIVRAGTRPDWQALLAAADAHTVRTATAGEVNEITDFAAGLVCPVGLPPDVLLLADSTPARSDVLYCPVGEGGVVLGIRTHDLLRVVAARRAPLTVPRQAQRDRHRPATLSL